MIGLARLSRDNGRLVEALVAKEVVDQFGLLIGAHADVNYANAAGWSPLHAAVERGTVEMASALIAANTNIDCVTADGQSPLHLAAKRGHARMVKLLIYHGALETIYTDPNGEPCAYINHINTLFKANPALYRLIHRSRCAECTVLGPKMVVCSRCKGAWYCSRVCQKRNWKREHIHVCEPAPLVRRENHLVEPMQLDQVA